MGTKNEVFKHIAILVPAVAKSFYSIAKNEMNKIKTAYNNTYTQYPSGHCA
jgi:hypothetical protein